MRQLRQAVVRRTEGRTTHQTLRERQKLLNRVRRIAGQIGAVEELLHADADCERALHTLAACRGAINSLMAEILEDHVMDHVVDPDSADDSPERQAAEQLLDIIKSYLR
jgi:FrmR/RcnR family transcriptional regulator, repressor of frmRAB operon